MSARPRSPRLVGLLGAVLLPITGPSPGAELTLFQTLQAPDAATGDQFGAGLALKLPYLLVGAPANGDGAAYVFWRDPNGGVMPWVYQGPLTPAALSANAQFGSSLALRDLTPALPQGPRIAVGAPNFSNTANAEGAVFLFNANLTEEPKLLAPQPGAQDLFGSAISMSSEFLVVGAPGDDGLGLDTGSAFLYRAKNVGSPVPTSFTWELQATKRDPGGVPVGNFGSAVANDNETLVVGAPGITIIDSGAAVVFDRNAGGVNHWDQVRRLTVPGGHRDAHFGLTVALDEDLVAVGAPGAQLAPGFAPGAVYLYGRNVNGTDQWGLIDRLVASDAEHRSGFGTSLAFSDGMLAVGAPRQTADTGLPGQGAVYFYEPDPVKGWREIGRFDLPGGPQLGGFGARTALEGSVLAGASPVATTSAGAQTGKVTVGHIRQVTPPPGNLIANGAFAGQPQQLTGGLPTGTGYWRSNKTTQAVEASTLPGVSPVLGTHVLQFVASGGSSNPTFSSTCELYQLVDLTPYAARIATGHVVARLSYEANRVAGDAQTDDQFVAHLRSYDGQPIDFPAQGAAFTESVVASENVDGDTGTWETITVELPVPSGTTFLAARIAALENVVNDVVSSEFDGHYADDVTLTLIANPDEPELLEVRMLNNCDIRLRYTTEPAFHYTLQKSTDLRSWTTIRWGMIGTGTPQTLIFAGGLIPSTYYRIGAAW